MTDSAVPAATIPAARSDRNSRQDKVTELVLSGGLTRREGQQLAVGDDEVGFPFQTTLLDETKSLGDRIRALTGCGWSRCRLAFEKRDSDLVFLRTIDRDVITGVGVSCNPYARSP
jgi:hypothetical protein